MNISAQSIEKKFRHEWIIKGFSGEFASGNRYAIIGPNGAGKSTLLKVLAQYTLPNKGSIEFLLAGNVIPAEQVHKQIAFAAPYVELIEEFTLGELLEFLVDTHFIPAHWTCDAFETYIELAPSKHKFIKNYSSGMRQKVKLGIAFISDRPILCLDEPTSNLDEQAKAWFKAKLSTQHEKLVLLASNEAFEIDLCNEHIRITDYKS